MGLGSQKAVRYLPDCRAIGLALLGKRHAVSRKHDKRRADGSAKAIHHGNAAFPSFHCHIRPSDHGGDREMGLGVPDNDGIADRRVHEAMGVQEGNLAELAPHWWWRLLRLPVVACPSDPAFPARCGAG